MLGCSLFSKEYWLGATEAEVSAAKVSAVEAARYELLYSKVNASAE